MTFQGCIKTLHFSNKNQHLIIGNQYFSNAERHLGNADRRMRC
jgi:hypothetical protein